MKLHRVLLSLFVGSCLFGSTLDVQAQPPDPVPLSMPELERVTNATPEGTIENFIELYNRNQWGVLPDLISGAEHDPAALAGIMGEIVKARGTLVLRVTDVQAETETDIEADPEEDEAVATLGDEAIATLTVHADDHLGLGMTWRETLKLRREQAMNLGHVWKLRPIEPRSLYSASDGYLQRLITLIAYPKDLLVVNHQQKSAQQVRQLALGVKQFIQDHDEQFALTTETVREKINPYIRSDALWTAPGDAPGTQSYSLNPYLVNVKEADITFIADTVMFYLGRNEKLDFRYGGKTVVGFADGHVEILTEERAKKLRWKP